MKWHCAMLFLCKILLASGLVAQAANKYFWYIYNLDGKQIGYAKVRYSFALRQGKYQKRKIRFRKMEKTAETETYSAMLNRDYSLRSAYFTDADSRHWTITVTDSIIIRTPQREIALPGEKFYLEIEDFLKALMLKKLSSGSLYKGKVLSSNRRQLTTSVARYQGVQTAVTGQPRPIHCFKVKTGELKNFWARAEMDVAGNLYGYRLGKFSLLRVPAKHALQIHRQQITIRAPFIFDVQQIRFLQLKFSPSNLLLNTSYQKIKGKRVLLKAPNLIRAKSKNRQIRQEAGLIPPNHPVIGKYARKIHQGQAAPRVVAGKIARWVQYNLIRPRTHGGRELLAKFAAIPDSVNRITMALCRAHEIPARLAAGFYYTPGQFSYVTWTEVHIAAWLPIYRGEMGKGARFLRIASEVDASADKITGVVIEIEKVVYPSGLINMNTENSYLVNTSNVVRDRLLGVSFRKPQSWTLINKDIEQDSLFLHCKQGSLMIVKVFHATKKLAEIIRSLQKRMGHQGKLRVLWRRPHAFPDGKGLDIALQSVAGTIIYRAFLAKKKDKGVLLLAIAAKSTPASLEQDFYSVISSLQLNRR